MTPHNTIKIVALGAIKDYLADNKDYAVGQCLFDLGATITEGEQCNGSWYCSTFKAIEDLRHWWATDDDWDDIMENLQDMEYDFSKVVLEPEPFHCSLCVAAVDKYWRMLLDSMFGSDEIATGEQLVELESLVMDWLNKAEELERKRAENNSNY